MPLLNDTLVKFEPETVETFLQNINMEIQQRNIAAQVIPHNQSLQVEDLSVQYFNAVSDFAFKYDYDPGVYPDNSMSLQKQSAPTPALYTNYTIPFLEFRRMQKSVLPVGAREILIAQRMANYREGIAIAGLAKFGNTSFADTTNNTTAMSGTANFSSFANARTTLETMFNELESNFSDSSVGTGTLTNRVVMLGVTPDVMQKIRSVYATYDEKYSALQLLNDKLREYTGMQGSSIFTSKYIGATYAIDEFGKESLTAGTTNAVMYVWDPIHFEVQESDTLAQQFPGDLKNPYSLAMMQRYTSPVFRVPEAFLYQGTVTIA